MQQSLPEVYFFHIPKTAGSSLAGLIRRFYPEEDAIPVFEWQELVALNRERINDYRCYTGHFGTGLYSVLDRPIPTVTLLRDPFERTVSHVRYAEKFVMQDKRLKAKWMMGSLVGYSFLSAAPKGLLGEIALENFQTRSLGVDVDLAPYLNAPRTGDPNNMEYGHLILAAQKGQDMEQILERAKRRLDSMAVVGTVERFAESVGLICDHLGVPAPDIMPEDNVAKGRSLKVKHRDSGKISAQTKADIDAITTYDRRLYEYASQLLDARLKQRSNLDIKNKEALFL